MSIKSLRVIGPVETQTLRVGLVGETGDTGPQGETGAGLPSGGTVGQYPVKASADDYDYTLTGGDAPHYAERASAVTGTPLDPASFGVTIRRHFQPHAIQPMRDEDVLSRADSFTLGQPFGLSGLIDDKYGLATGTYNWDAATNPIKFTPGFIMPALAAQCRIQTMPGSGTRDVTLAFQKSNADYIGFTYIVGSNTIGIATVVNGTPTSYASGSLTLTAPYDIGMTLVNNSLNVWARESNGIWRVVLRQDVQDTNIDFRTTADLWLTTATFWNYTDNSVIKTSHFYAGYASPSGFIGSCLVKALDGRPITRNGKYYLVEMMCFPASSGGDQTINAAGWGIYSFDPFTWEYKLEARLAFERGTKTYLENSGYLGWDHDNQEWLVLSPNWGDWPDPDIQIYKYTSKDDLLSGYHRLSGGSLLSVPTDTTAYDPDLIVKNGFYYMVYSAANEAGTHHYPRLARGTSVDTLTTLVASIDTGPQQEGSRIWRVGGEDYAAWCADDGKVYVYDLANLTPVGDFSNVINTVSASHPCYLPRVVNGVTKPLLLGFHGGHSLAGYLFASGEQVIGEFSQTQTGSDWPAP